MRGREEFAVDSRGKGDSAVDLRGEEGGSARKGIAGNDDTEEGKG